MNLNPLLFTFAGIFLFMWVSSVILSPPRASADSSNTSDSATSIAVIGEEAAAGLDLEVLPGLVQASTSAETLETALNAENGPNNLDLNDDGIIDFIKVTEFSNEVSNQTRYGFSLTVDVTASEEQEIAVIEITPTTDDNANVTVSGNEQIYGRGAHYSAGFPIGTFLMMSYLLSPHRPFFSPYGYGAYPGYYGARNTVDSSTYRNRANSYKSSSVARSQTGSTLTSPNANKSAASIKKSLRNPTATQKSFQARNPSRAAATGGFGNRTTSSRSQGFGSRAPARSFASSRRSFGGSFGK
ncbi:hypothetical protein COTS27_01646 [Spirochaetota bacterium]|nr:hypothetical protein COTS27_01646 [Spirochaetota bacterium]